MDKHEQAQRFAEILLSTTHANHGYLGEMEIENIKDTAFALADAMQAEAKKREDTSRPDVLQDDWQPDWSKYPTGYDFFCVIQSGIGFVCEQKPKILENTWSMDFSSIKVLKHNYQGDWRDSLRKRPEGE